MGVAQIAEGVHRSVGRTVGLHHRSAPGRTRGLTGWIYRRIIRLTRRVGRDADALLGRLGPWLEADLTPESRPRQAVLAALNGVMGDRLVASGNALASTMTLRHRGEVLEKGSPVPGASSKVLLLIHGLCMNDLQWQAQHDGRPIDHGADLAAALGYTPVYVRYNSGLPIAQNGRSLGEHLERLVADWPVPIDDLTVVAHSMGGLVTRSAVHVANDSGHRWNERLRTVVFLGTPHHGAALERGGNVVDQILGRSRYTVPFAALGHLRSAGITDLRYGSLLDAGEIGSSRFRRAPDQRPITPLPEGVKCYAIAATTAKTRTVLADRLVGDGLVPVRSALGQHDDMRRTLAFTDTAVVHKAHHFALLSRPEVSRQLLNWLAPARLETLPG